MSSKCVPNLQGQSRCFYCLEQHEIVFTEITQHCVQLLRKIKNKHL